MENAGGDTAPILIAVGGWMASGKSSLASALARRIGARLISADAVRRELHEAGREDAFVPGFSAKLYPLVLRRAEEALESGVAVVVDGTFRSRSLRSTARAVARRLDVPFRFVECRADAETCRQRLRERERETGARGWLAMFDAFLDLWEPPAELPPGEHLCIDTERPLDESLVALLDELGGLRGIPRGGEPGRRPG